MRPMDIKAPSKANVSKIHQKTRDVLRFKEEELLLQRIINLTEGRFSNEIDVRKCLQYELSIIPPALLNESS